jgi:acylphosphatase
VKRVHLIISGDVQGVGFRAWVLWLAQELHLTGWVKNREDDAVELIAEGMKENLEEFVKQCQHGPEVSWVEHVDVKWSPAIGEFVGFEVIY